MSENIGNQDNREIVRSPFRADEEQPYIFISYSHKDRKRVFPIIKRLYEQGWRIWYDEGLEIATNYLATLSQHIKNCAAFLLFVTENSVKSEFVCEKELIVASNYNKIIARCVLDEAAQFSGEAKDVLDIVTASRKHPKTNEAGLEAALETIEGLERGEPRAAKEITITSWRPVADGTDGEYSWEPCDGGVRLTRYNGKDEEVHIPAEYPTASGQEVVELNDIFHYGSIVRRVWVPKTVKRIREGLFGRFNHPTDIYIPTGVEEIASNAFEFINTESFRIHCAEDSEAHRYALEHKFNVVLDDSLRVKEANEVPYVYCSYAPDAKERVDQIIEKLTAAGCEVRVSGSANRMEWLGMLNQSRCFIAFISWEYITDRYIEELMLASKSRKKLTMYKLEDCALPPELELTHPADQQLRYNELTEKERTANLVEWLGLNGCRRAVSVQDFVSQETRDGIALLKYTGSGGDVVIQQEYGGIPVTSIGKGAFYGCSKLTSVVIPNSVTEIGDIAFYGCSSLTSVTIPESVTAISEGTFYGCSGLTSVTIPDSVTTIGWSAFRDCLRLTSIDIPDSVNLIGDYAFEDCSGLTSITIPDSVTTIGNDMFNGCSSLTSVSISNSVTEIGNWAFCNCSGLTSVTIPDSVTLICDLAFFCCDGLTSVTISNSVTEIEDSAFFGCHNLTISCSKNSCAWAYCEENHIPHKELADVPAKAPDRRSSAWWLVPAALALALGGAAAVQITGLFDILGAIGSLLG